MKKLIYYAATSLDYKIADAHDQVNWLDELPNPQNLDYGHAQFYSSIDTTLMGMNTYKILESYEGPFPYKETKNYVFTSKNDRTATQYLEFINEPAVPFVKSLKAQPGRDIWLVGGGALGSSLLEAGLIDELMLFVFPVLLGHGIPLFKSVNSHQWLKLVHSQPYDTGVMALHYQVITQNEGRPTTSTV